MGQFCGKCGGELKEGAAFCGKCGASISKRADIREGIQTDPASVQKGGMGAGGDGKSMETEGIHGDNGIQDVNGSASADKSVSTDANAGQNRSDDKSVNAGEKEKTAESPDEGKHAPEGGKGRKKRLPVLMAVLLLLLAGAAAGGIWYFTSDGYQYQKSMKMAQAALEEGEYGEALEHYEDALSFDETVVEVYVQMADVYLLGCSTENASEQLQYAVKILKRGVKRVERKKDKATLEDKLLEVYLSGTDILVQGGAFDAARELLVQGQEQMEESGEGSLLDKLAEVYLAEAETLYQAGNPEQALQVLTQGQERTGNAVLGERMQEWQEAYAQAAEEEQDSQGEAQGSTEGEGNLAEGTDPGSNGDAGVEPAPEEVDPAALRQARLLEFIQFSDKKYFTQEEIALFDVDTCRLARNGIYAWMGRKFKDEALQMYFASYDWYVPSIEPGDFQESMLNEYQIANRDLIVAYEKSLEGQIPGIQMNNVVSVTASSALSEHNMTHSAERLIDGDPATAWVEGVSGQGTGESVTFTFDGIYKVTGLKICGGYQKDEKRYSENSRPTDIRLEFSDGSTQSVTLQDLMQEQTVSFSAPVNTSYVTIVIESVYEGSKYEDTAISEVTFY